jgi:DNA-binding response OmpR family regulator
LLVADDSTTIQRVVELTFASENIQVVAVGDGEQAITRIPIEQPDIVLADIAMPKRDGYEVSAFVKSRRELAHVPVLLLAGAFEPVDDTKARDSRSDGVIVKPFDPRQMVTRVRELLSAAPQAEPAVTSATGGDQGSGDEYFDRLDHALRTRATSKPEIPLPIAPPDHTDTGSTTDIPTVESVLDLSAVASATEAQPVEGAPHARGGETISDDLIDDIASRLLERLSRGELREAVSAVVREIVEERSRGR